MVNIALLLGFTFSGAALGLLLLRSGGLLLALSKLATRTRTGLQEETNMLPVREADPEPAAESQSEETQNAAPEVASSFPVYGPILVASEKVESCPCGLVLPENALMEHAQSTGHVGPGSSVSVRTGKIWDLEQATVEQTSPDCYKCGKPVKGLKRVGRTIYVSHTGCISSSSGKTRTRRKRAVAIQNSKSVEREQAVQLSLGVKCPICWGPVQETGSVTTLSSTGNVLRFHNRCMVSDPWKNFA